MKKLWLIVVAMWAFGIYPTHAENIEATEKLTKTAAPVTVSVNVNPASSKVKAGKFDFARNCVEERSVAIEALCIQHGQKDAARDSVLVSAGAAILSTLSAVIASVSLLVAFRSQRAWITFYGCEFDINDGGKNPNILVKMSWKNTGRSPATNVTYHFGYDILDKKNIRPLRLDKTQLTHNVSMDKLLASDKIIEMEPMIITEPEARDFDNYQIFVYAQVTYKDVFWPLVTNKSEACRMLRVKLKHMDIVGPAQYNTLS